MRHLFLALLLVPLLASAEDRVVRLVPLGDVEPNLLRDVAATGATVVDHGLGVIDPMAELILIQRTAVALAEARATGSWRRT